MPLPAHFRTTVALAASLLLSAPALHAQAAAKNRSPAATPGAIAGSYAGTATVPLGDSTIVVPVSYTFTPTGASAGTAIVPGQGSGTISNVVRSGTRLRFRVTAGENKQLEHDGTVAPDGSIEGFVNLDSKPVAKFRIAPGSLPPARGGAAPKPKGTR